MAGILGSFDLFTFIGWVDVVMGSVILVALVWFAWRFFRGDISLDDPGGSMGRQLFGRWRDDQRPEDWLKK